MLKKRKFETKSNGQILLEFFIEEDRSSLKLKVQEDTTIQQVKNKLRDCYPIEKGKAWDLFCNRKLLKNNITCKQIWESRKKPFLISAKTIRCFEREDYAYKMFPFSDITQLVWYGEDTIILSYSPSKRHQRLAMLNIETRKYLHSNILANFEGEIKYITVSPDLKYFAFVFSSSLVYLFDMVRNPIQYQSRRSLSPLELNFLQFSFDSKKLFASSASFTEIFDVYNFYSPSKTFNQPCTTLVPNYPTLFLNSRNIIDTQLEKIITSFSFSNKKITHTKISGDNQAIGHGWDEDFGFLRTKLLITPFDLQKLIQEGQLVEKETWEFNGSIPSVSGKEYNLVTQDERACSILDLDGNSIQEIQKHNLVQHFTMISPKKQKIAVFDQKDIRIYWHLNYYKKLVLDLLLLAREKCEDSPFYKDNLPRDVLIYIINFCNLL